MSAGSTPARASVSCQASSLISVAYGLASGLFWFGRGCGILARFVGVVVTKADIRPAGTVVGIKWRPGGLTISSSAARVAGPLQRAVRPRSLVRPYPEDYEVPTCGNDSDGVASEAQGTGQRIAISGRCGRRNLENETRPSIRRNYGAGQ